MAGESLLAATHRCQSSQILQVHKMCSSTEDQTEVGCSLLLNTYLYICVSTSMYLPPTSLSLSLSQTLSLSLPIHEKGFTMHSDLNGSLTPHTAKLCGTRRIHEAL